LDGPVQDCNRLLDLGVTPGEDVVSALGQRGARIGDRFRRRYKLSRCLGLEQERLHRHGFLRSVVIANGEFDPAAFMARTCSRASAGVFGR
jgi:hypothetical protein